MEKEIEQVEGGERVDRGAGRLTERDRQVVASLAIARYLASGQLQRLFFPGRSRTYLKRLSALAGLTERKVFTPPYLRRLPYRTAKGGMETAWALTDAGYVLAADILGSQLRSPSK